MTVRSPISGTFWSDEEELKLLEYIRSNGKIVLQHHVQAMSVLVPGRSADACYMKARHLAEVHGLVDMLLTIGGGTYGPVSGMPPVAPPVPLSTVPSLWPVSDAAAVDFAVVHRYLTVLYKRVAEVEEWQAESLQQVRELRTNIEQLRAALECEIAKLEQ